LQAVRLVVAGVEGEGSTFGVGWGKPAQAAAGQSSLAEKRECLVSWSEVWERGGPRKERRQVRGAAGCAGKSAWHAALTQRRRDAAEAAPHG
jgi:hypothetical protein